MIEHELDKICEQFNDFIKENYKKRKRIKRRFTVIRICWAAVVLSIFMTAPKSIFLFVVLILFFMFGAIVITKIKHNKLKKIHGQYKQTILPYILNLIDNSLVYNVHKGHSKEEFKSTEMYNNNIDTYKSGDLIEGIVNNTSIKISHIFAERVEEETDSNGNSSTTYHTIFSGIFVTLDFNKYFKGKTRLHTKGRVSNSEPSMWTLFSNYNKITLENSDFNNLYKVITTDEQQAYYILSPSLMECLIKLYQSSKSGIGIAFINNMMYIGFESSSFLEINPDDDIKQSIKQLYLEIKSIIDIIDELNLNNRIWTKR